MSSKLRNTTLITGALALGIGLGWTARDARVAGAQGKRAANTTINLADLKIEDAQYDGKPTGKAAVYIDGETAGTKSMNVGRFLLDPGAEPHPPHRHADEEILIVSRGQGEIVCDGKTYQVRPGSVMYADPNVEHGIKNTGTRPIEFYWIKYIPKSGN
jgi:quercetin dioxygenase-like cupin family protein